MSFLCTPIYLPDPGHEDRMSHQGPFYAIFCDEWRGCVTSRASRDRKLAQYPHASAWETSTWANFDRMWTLQCTEYHHHKEASTPQGFVPLSPESTPPSSPSDLTASTPPCTPSPAAASASIKKPNQERADNIARTLPEGVGRGVVPHLASPRPLPVPMTPRRAEPKAAGPHNARLLREELDFLAATRPPPVPISPERLRQQFIRVLGAEAARPPAAKASGASSPKKTRRSEATGAATPIARPPTTLFIPRPHQQSYPRHLAGVQVVDAGESAGDPLMYAVSGQNRIFHDRNRALAAFKSKPGADLIFSRDEDEVFGFLAEGVDSKEVEGKVNVK
ncbi:hypothetical protein B0H13DRAFT_2370876 [Mycena leptocephala]|nr:hypothetical protein B0H13DRAFT_2370876 [Mycena leptocephala]